MTDWGGLLVLVLILAGVNVAVWAFGVDSCDAADRDPFFPDGSHGVSGLPHHRARHD
jgi:hypothetical protein